jgi:hypothetical protein
MHDAFGFKSVFHEHHASCWFVAGFVASHAAY